VTCHFDQHAGHGVVSSGARSPEPPPWRVERPSQHTAFAVAVLVARAGVPDAECETALSPVTWAA
jgi:hypothetical protein